VLQRWSRRASFARRGLALGQTEPFTLLAMMDDAQHLFREPVGNFHDKDCIANRIEGASLL
jgi:hypothetical protein